jgi:nitrite reductase/ring-hydroxylating ferredoxin subunit
MQKVNLNKLKLIFSFLLISNLFLTCKEQTDNIPQVYVDIQIDLNDPQYFQLRLVGSYVYVTGGYSGIILYRLSEDEFIAYDRACPYDYDCGKVYVDDYNFSAVDTDCCKSEYSLMLDGAVTKGPSVFPLRKYFVTYNQNVEMLRITN